MPQIRRLAPAEITQVQQWRFENLSNDQMRQHFPWLTDSMIGTYAPSELRGAKLRVTKYIKDHPGIDYKDIPFREIDASPADAAQQLYSLRRANLVTFLERKVSLIGGDHHAKSDGSKGIYNIRLTEMGIRRVEMSGIVASSRMASRNPHKAIADKVAPVPPVLPSIGTDPEGFLVYADDTHVEAPSIPEPSESIAESAAPIEAVATITEPTPTYPILAELRRKEARIHAANRLIDQAMNLYDKADLTAEALELLDHLGKTQVKFTPTELELMRMADDAGIK